MRADEVLSWWRHQMETFSALLAICAGNSPVPVNSPHKGQWRGALMFSSICAWISGWVNNREAGDLRRYRTHYDVIVMVIIPELASNIIVSQTKFFFFFKLILQNYLSIPNLQRLHRWRLDMWWLILAWCWWNLLTSANQFAQIGSCDRSRIHDPDLGGTREKYLS